MAWARKQSPSGYTADVLTSWLQKCIRRGWDADLVVPLGELVAMRFGRAVMNRLLIITLEDVGLAYSAAPSIAVREYEAWAEAVREVPGSSKTHGPENLDAVRALCRLALALCRAPHKSRMVAMCNMVVAFNGLDGDKVSHYSDGDGATTYKEALLIDVACGSERDAIQNASRMYHGNKGNAAWVLCAVAEAELDSKRLPRVMECAYLANLAQMEALGSPRLALHAGVIAACRDLDDVLPIHLHTESLEGLDALVKFVLDRPWKDSNSAPQPHDAVFDKHTGIGAAKKRGIEHFLKEAAVLNVGPPAHFEDNYSAQAANLYYMLEEIPEYGTKYAHASTLYDLWEDGPLATAPTLAEHVSDDGTQLAQLPCGGKPRTVFANLRTGGMPVVLKGPIKFTPALSHVLADRLKHVSHMMRAGCKLVALREGIFVQSEDFGTHPETLRGGPYMMGQHGMEQVVMRGLAPSVRLADMKDQCVIWMMLGHFDKNVWNKLMLNFLRVLLWRMSVGATDSHAGNVLMRRSDRKPVLRTHAEIDMSTYELMSVDEARLYQPEATLYLTCKRPSAEDVRLYTAALMSHMDGFKRYAVLLRSRMTDGDGGLCAFEECGLLGVAQKRLALTAAVLQRVENMPHTEDACQALFPPLHGRKRRAENPA